MSGDDYSWMDEGRQSFDDVRREIERMGCGCPDPISHWSQHVAQGKNAKEARIRWQTKINFDA